jgi:hypothetical protein
MSPLLLAGFMAFWPAASYLLRCAFAGRWVRIDPGQALVHAAAVTLLGMTGEVLFGTVYHAVFDRPLWVYEYLPIHHGYTSVFSLYVWSFYGFHVSLFHDVPPAGQRAADTRLALVVAAEAVLLEMACNLGFLALFGQYLFFYLPGDLWHLSSLQIVPFYFVAGLGIAKTLRRFRHDPAFFTVLSALVAGVLVLGGGR